MLTNVWQHTVSHSVSVVMRRTLEKQQIPPNAPSIRQIILFLLGVLVLNK